MDASVGFVMSSLSFPAIVTCRVCPRTMPVKRRWLPVCRTKRKPLPSNMRMTSWTFMAECDPDHCAHHRPTLEQ